MNRKIIVAVTGASGSIYAQRLLFHLEKLTSQYDEIALIFSETAIKVWDFELGIEKPSSDKIKVFKNDNYFAPPASGSANYDCMIIIPASMGSIGRIASGISSDLISRAADVMLKEKRQLIIVARETPLNNIHLENLLKVSKAGAQIIPASPSFYSKPSTIIELVDTVIERVLSNAGFEFEGYRWGE